MRGLVYILLLTLLFWIVPSDDYSLKADSLTQTGLTSVERETLVRYTNPNNHSGKFKPEQTSALDMATLSDQQFNVPNEEIVTHGFRTGEALGYRGGRAIRHHFCTLLSLECTEE